MIKYVLDNTISLNNTFTEAVHRLRSTKKFNFLKIILFYDSQVFAVYGY